MSAPVEETTQSDGARQVPRRRWVSAGVVGLVLACLGALAGGVGALFMLGLGAMVVGVLMIMGLRPFGFSGRMTGAGIIVGASIGLLLVVDNLPVPPTPPEGGTSVAAPGPLTSAAGPIAAGVYAGEFVVTRDLNNFPADGADVSLLDQAFPRTFTLGKDCDSGAGTCTISHDALHLGDPSSLTLAWEWAAGDKRSRTASYVARTFSTCVTDDGVAVGDFDNTITFTLVLSDPVRTASGQLVWNTADVTYLEEGVSDDTDVGCYTSAYEARGHLTRQD